MKKNIFLLLLLAFSMQSFSQLAFYKVSRADKVLNTVPRFAFDIGIPVNIIGPWAFIKSDAAYLESGFFVTNNGIIYDEDKNRNLQKVIGLSLPIRAGKIIQNKYYLGTGVNFNFNVHYKHKIYDYGTNDNKQVVESAFLSKKVNLFYPSVEFYAGISIHGLGRFGIRAQVFTASMMNQAYSENINGIDIRPYENLVVTQNFKILLSYNPGL